MSVEYPQALLHQTNNNTDASMQMVGDIYKEHYGWLYGWMRKKLGSSDRAEDLSHDTFIKLMMSRQAETLREPRAFLIKIAHDLLVNLWRRQDLERAYLDAIACMPEASYPSPEDRVIAIEVLRELDAMLDRLPAKARTAFLLSHLDHLTYAEIAIQIGVSERMVKKYMAQAMLNCLMISAA